MLRLLGISAILSAAIAAAACNAYDPDLGDKPYRCGTKSPKCPDGYEAVEVGPPNLCECHLDGEGGGEPTIDAAPGCQGSTGEPNETTASATASPIGLGSSTAVYNAQSICTVGDVDTYSFSTQQPNQTITATLQFNPTIGQLTVRIIDSQSTVMAMGTTQGQNQIATTSIVTSGTYYVQVASTSGTTTYDLSLAVQ